MQIQHAAGVDISLRESRGDAGHAVGDLDTADVNVAVDRFAVDGVVDRGAAGRAQNIAIESKEQTLRRNSAQGTGDAECIGANRIGIGRWRAGRARRSVLRDGDVDRTFIGNAAVAVGNVDIKAVGAIVVNVVGAVLELAAGEIAFTEGRTAADQHAIERQKTARRINADRIGAPARRTVGIAGKQIAGARRIRDHNVGGALHHRQIVCHQHRRVVARRHADVDRGVGGRRG